jgi:hypothetical protein
MERMKIELSEFSVAAICLTIIVSAVAYFHTHRTYPPAPAVPCPTLPAITVMPAVIPQPKVIIKLIPAPQPKPQMQVTPEVSPDSDVPVDQNDQRNVILTSGGPLLVPPRAGVVIPNSLHHSMSEMEKVNVICSLCD